MKVLLLSIKPEYVESILSGEKKYEYRRRLAKINSEIMLIYSTYPVMKVVAEVKIIRTLEAAPTALWENTKQSAGISRKKFREYFKGQKKAYAYELGEVNIFREPKELSQYEISMPPQSFLYVDI